MAEAFQQSEALVRHLKSHNIDNMYSDSAGHPLVFPTASGPGPDGSTAAAAQRSWCAAAAKLGQADIDRLEQKFVEDIWQLLGSAHYRLLSQDEWVTALKEDFTVNIFNKHVMPHLRVQGCIFCFTIVNLQAGWPVQTSLCCAFCYRFSS